MRTYLSCNKFLIYLLFVLITGKVLWYDSTKGFGLVETEEGNRVLIRHKDINEGGKIPKPGQTIQFELKRENNYIVGKNIQFV